MERAHVLVGSKQRLTLLIDDPTSSRKNSDNAGDQRNKFIPVAFRNSYPHRKSGRRETTWLHGRSLLKDDSCLFFCRPGLFQKNSPARHLPRPSPGGPEETRLGLAGRRPLYRPLSSEPFNRGRLEHSLILPLIPYIIRIKPHIDFIGPPEPTPVKLMPHEGKFWGLGLRSACWDAWLQLGDLVFERLFGSSGGRCRESDGVSWPFTQKVRLR